MAKTGSKVNGASPSDAQGNLVIIPAAFTAQDATGTPNKSPKTVSSSVITLVVPDKAVFFVAEVPAGTADCRVSDESTAADHYFVVTHVQGPKRFPCAGMQNIYLLRDAAADVTLQFYFETLN